MNLNQALSDLDRRIAELVIIRDDCAEKIKKLESLRSIVANDPTLGAELRHAFGSGPEPTTALDNQNQFHRPTRRSSSEEVFELIADYLRRCGNKWQTVRQISEGAQLNQNVVNALLYTSYLKDEFENQKESGRRKMWRLKQTTSNSPTGVADSINGFEVEK
jgi:hypothetical protein